MIIEWNIFKANILSPYFNLCVGHYTKSILFNYSNTNLAYFTKNLIFIIHLCHLYLFFFKERRLFMKSILVDISKI